MISPTERFTSRVADYAKTRPGYPPEVLRLLEAECGLAPTHIVADVGSGTGLLTELFLKNGNQVFGVEPNAAMRLAGEERLRGFADFTSITGTAEQTTLPAASVDFVVAGQAFHWFDCAAARTEFRRILRPTGWVALVWNDQRRDTTPYLAAHENLLRTFAADRYALERGMRDRDFAEFFAPGGYQIRSFDNSQTLDYETLKGRVLSSSFAPQAGHPNYELMLGALRALFDEHSRAGTVTIEYDTRVYYGRLAFDEIRGDETRNAERAG